MWSDIKTTFKSGNILVKFIYINTVVFLLVNILNLLFWLGNTQGFSLVSVLGVPASFPKLLQQPWGIFSYMFLHENIWHILFNMLVLYFSGSIFLEYLGERRFSVTYILGGLAGAILYILTFNLFPVFKPVLNVSTAIGASAAVMAILISIATYIPHYAVHLLFLGPVKLKYIALFYILIDLLSISGSNSGGHIAHLGGAIYGYFYIKSTQNGNDWSVSISNLLNKLWGLFKAKQKMKTVHFSSSKKTNPTSKNDQARIDSILDKISKSGYESLTKEEKEFLFNTSNR
ncbi:MAG: rhomboid family intramembrane serine protease [Bacteroidetes bacterium]|nr:rhomboid family intramembrane serine protease [Bacteroidota bacterium]MBV6461555.1 hypothetical protein [Flavobacteriales bacterium]WKZ74037.1 MAG: rhomboid family intramembrane serine protease [Vicingaceae bacterium]MCL4817169.1 rhomboid family intramembrane serine protease [Flavobacteriales bacterium]NOG95876.1 rhomboid family intramembrane serine protease [Bacteroidota bacterium]